MTHEWVRGYQAHANDLQALAGSRGLLTPELQQLLDDLMHDALVIEHELDNRRQRQRLRAKREVKDEAEEEQADLRAGAGLEAGGAEGATGEELRPGKPGAAVRPGRRRQGARADRHSPDQAWLADPATGRAL